MRVLWPSIIPRACPSNHYFQGYRERCLRFCRLTEPVSLLQSRKKKNQTDHRTLTAFGTKCFFTLCFVTPESNPAKTKRGIQRPYIAPVDVLITSSGDNGIGDCWCVQNVFAIVAAIRCTLVEQSVVESQKRTHTCGHAKTCRSRDKPMVGSLSYVLGLQRGPVVQHSIAAGGLMILTLVKKANHRGVCGAKYPAEKIITASARFCGTMHIADPFPPRNNAMRRSWTLLIHRHG